MSWHGLRAIRCPLARRVDQREDMAGQAAERRLDAAERMATSRDLILDIAAHFGAPEELLRPYRVTSPPHPQISP